MAILLRAVASGDVELVLTRRGADLTHHPGQVAFPGGRLESGETPEQAALREAAEEVALQPSSVRPLGQLPAFYVPPSRFWLHPVVLHWHQPHRLRPAQAEVAEIFVVRVSELTEHSRLRVVQLSSRGATWAWQLKGGRLLWGATGIAVAMLLDRLVPGWTAGTSPVTMGAERRLDPMELLRPPGPRPARLSPASSLLAPLAERPLATVPRSASRGGFDPALIGPAGAVVAQAAQALLPHGRRRVTILAGPGGTGAVGLATADALRTAGCEVAVVAVGRRAAGAASAAAPPPRPVAPPTEGVLPAHDLVVDAMLGSGFRPPLRGQVARLVAALGGTAAPQLAVDLPTGLDPERGPVGEAVAADVTVAIGAASPVLAMPAAEPFIGDCYLWQPAEGLTLERILLR